MYICSDCDYVTNIKCNFSKHLKTKKHIKNLSNPLPNNDKPKTAYTFLPSKLPETSQNCPILPNSAQNCPFLPNSALFCPQIPNSYTFSNLDDNSFKNNVDSINDEDNLSCEYCNRVFKRKYHLTRHYNTCKIKEKFNYKKLYEEALNQKAKSEESKDKIISQLTDQLERVIEKVGDTHITQNTIILNCYGSENIEHITDKYKLELLKLPYSMIPKLIENVHFDPNYPENNNIYIPNKKEPYVKVFHDNKWVYKDRNKTINELIDKNYNRLDEYYQKKAIMHMGEEHINRYLEFQTNKESNNDDLIKDVKKNVEIILINNKNINL